MERHMKQDIYFFSIIVAIIILVCLGFYAALTSNNKYEDAYFQSGLKNYRIDCPYNQYYVSGHSVSRYQNSMSVTTYHDNHSFLKKYIKTEVGFSGVCTAVQI